MLQKNFFAWARRTRASPGKLAGKRNRVPFDPTGERLTEGACSVYQTHSLRTMGDRVQVDSETGQPVIKKSWKEKYNRSMTFKNIVIVPCREDTSLAARSARAQQNDAMDLKFGYERHVSPEDRVGWLINMHPVCGSMVSPLQCSSADCHPCS